MDGEAPPPAYMLYMYDMGDMPDDMGDMPDDMGDMPDDMGDMPDDMGDMPATTGLVSGVGRWVAGLDPSIPPVKWNSGDSWEADEGEEAEDGVRSSGRESPSALPLLAAGLGGDCISDAGNKKRLTLVLS